MQLRRTIIQLLTILDYKKFLITNIIKKLKLFVQFLKFLNKYFVFLFFSCIINFIYFPSLFSSYFAIGNPNTALVFPVNISCFFYSQCLCVFSFKCICVASFFAYRLVVRSTFGPCIFKGTYLYIIMPAICTWPRLYQKTYKHTRSHTTIISHHIWPKNTWRRQSRQNKKERPRRRHHITSTMISLLHLVLIGGEE